LIETLVPINDYKLITDGCGSYKINIDFKQKFNIAGFDSCCNRHDICYQNCGKTKTECDIEFDECLVVDCNQISQIKKWSRTKLFGN
jgi:secretory phospholipase A2